MNRAYNVLWDLTMAAALALVVYNVYRAWPHLMF